MAAALEGYASATSVAPGETLDLHVRASSAAFAHVAMQVVRRGRTDEPMLATTGDAFVPDGVQDDAALAVAGCNWPAADGLRITVPADWRSGYYLAHVSSGGAETWIPFFVRAANPGAQSRILVKMSDATAQAYTAWGGRSLYTAPHAPHISFDRPYDDLALFERYQVPFLQWLESRGIAYDLCSSLDLHRDPQLLAPYRLLVSIGHDEYWSLEMRDAVEAFVAAGGNVAFFSANTCYWQIRLALDGARIMTCYKETEGNPPDPSRDDPRRVTVRWYEPPVNRPESRLTGVSYKYGAGWWIDPTVPAQRYRGYTVADAGDWTLAGTGARNGDMFGAGTSVDDAILGYETDAVGDGTPPDFRVVARADLRDWAPHGQGGGASLGWYQRRGVVFTAGTVNWAGGLSAGGTNVVDTIASNVLRALTAAPVQPLAIPNADFSDWNGDLPAFWTIDGDGTLDAADPDEDANANTFRFAPQPVLARIDASTGETWAGRPDLSLDGRTRYGAGAWVRASSRGATIRLQTTDTWTDFGRAEHSGNGQWEYLFALGTPGRDGAVPARVKLQVAAGTQAVYGGVTVVPAFAPAP